MRSVAARTRHDVYDRGARPPEFCGKAIRRHLKSLDRILRDVLQRSADDIFVVVHAVDGHVSATTRLARGRDDDRLRFGRIEVGSRRVAGGQKGQLQEIAAVQR